MEQQESLNRRSFLKMVGGIAGSSTLSQLYLLSNSDASLSQQKKLPITAVVTEYSENSHSDMIIGRILNGLDLNGGPGPALKLVSMYTDQVPDSDLSRRLSQRHGFHIATTIEEALTLGSNRLQVAGVISIGEQGSYAIDPQTGQTMYPRRRFFEDIVACFRRVNEVAPVFTDKHLACNWFDAEYIYTTAKKMGIPLMAGSSLPLACRNPSLVLARNQSVKEAFTIGYGPHEAYGFHALEALQCIVERRLGGETGIAAVRALQGDAIIRAHRNGEWDECLLDAAMDVIPGSTKADLSKLDRTAAFYQLFYRDGMRATIAMANGLVEDFSCSVHVSNESKITAATHFELDKKRPFDHFRNLTLVIDSFIHTHRSPYPIERTLLTTGLIHEIMKSMRAQGKIMETPELGIRYQASTDLNICSA